MLDMSVRLFFWDIEYFEVECPSDFDAQLFVVELARDTVRRVALWPGSSEDFL